MLSTYLESLNLAQLERLYGRCWERMTRGDGYQPYGYDWPAIRASYPGWYVILKEIMKVGYSKNKGE